MSSTRSKVHGLSKEERSSFFDSQERAFNDDSENETGMIPSKRNRSTSIDEYKKDESEPSEDEKPHSSLKKQKTLERMIHKKDLLFKGLKFCKYKDKTTMICSNKSVFIPTSPKSNIFRKRCTVFSKNGAEVAHEFDDSVTHLLLSKYYWKGGGVWRYIKRDQLPKGTVALKDTWPSDCLDKDRLLDVKEYEVVLKEPVKPISSPKKPGTPPREVKHSELERLIDETKSLENLSYKGSVKDYKCMKKKPSEEKSDHPNALAIEIFGMVRDRYLLLNNEIKANSYSKAINTLEKIRRPIRTVKDALKLDSIGRSMGAKIEEIYRTGYLSQLDKFDEDRIKGLKLLTGIYGVGPVISNKWYDEGVRTFEDALARPDLTPQQRIGIEHYDDFSVRIPREVVAQHFKIVKDAIAKFDPNMEVYCMGSYRRGQPDCGDIDIIVTKKEANVDELRRFVANDLIPFLKEQGFIKYTLSGGGPNDGRWLGASALSDGIWRRMDILPVGAESLGSALIYYTGDSIFNRSLRLLAKRKGLHLSDTGLYKTNKNGPKIAGKDEKEIFDILGVTYFKPEDRIRE